MAEREPCGKCSTGFLVPEIISTAGGAGREVAKTCKICGYARYYPITAGPSPQRRQLMKNARDSMVKNAHEAAAQAEKRKNQPRKKQRLGLSIPEEHRSLCGVENCDNYIMLPRNKSGMCAPCAKKMRRWKERGHKTPIPFVLDEAATTEQQKKWVVNPERIKLQQERENKANQG